MTKDLIKNKNNISLTETIANSFNNMNDECKIKLVGVVIIGLIGLISVLKGNKTNVSIGPLSFNCVKD